MLDDRHHPTSSIGIAAKPLVLRAIAVAGLAAVIASAALAAATGHAVLHATLMCWIVLSYVLSGVLAWWHRPDSRIGALMILAGFATFLATLSWAGGQVPHAIGQAFDLVPVALILHVFLAYPTGRLRGRLERVLLTVGYTAAIGAQLAVMLLGGLGPGQVLTMTDEAAWAGVLHDVELVVISGVAIGGVVVLATRRRAEGQPLRRSLSLLIDSFALGFIMIAFLLLAGVFEGRPFPVVQAVALAALGLAPIAFVAGLLTARLARTAVGDLLLALRAPPVDLREPLARALRDPSLTIAYWLPQFGSWADQDGRPVVLPPDDGRSAVTLIGTGVEPMAALVHDPALNDEPELLDAVRAAAWIALENGRLRAEQRAHLDELRGSRARVIEAGQKERQRLERDLHDGAQQRLVALSLDLGLLESRLDTDSAARPVLAQAKREIALSLDELRDLARGLHPAVLSAHGLDVALESLAARAAVPVRLMVDVGGRLAEQVEVAAYYVVCESLANVAKHAQATAAIVDVVRKDGCVVVEVVDDGIGGADTERGTGLRGLADRVEALDGRLRVWTPLRAGTRVRAEIPCG
ncbi:sensor histidine kinase [Jiangella ureilytica]|uniref:histidine kinase n=1 Tax=Jiangella ureilytica TaxID=2530374 RepID=A0A4V2XXH3_9ACTN|nr:histidine kinase [Jiangella ureilytica]TDC53235.1 sensor histidine kinase [Jiangella ureilytica]